MTELQSHLEGRVVSVPDHVYSVYLKAEPARVWRAITEGAETVQYYYGTRVASSWAPGSPITYTYPDGTVAAGGEVIECDPPNRLVMTFHARWDQAFAAAAPVRMSWELEAAGGTTKLTVVTSGLEPGSPMAEELGGGIVFIVSGLKTLVETGAPLAGGAGG